jgi:hypothetical protein
MDTQEEKTDRNINPLLREDAFLRKNEEIECSLKRL